MKKIFIFLMAAFTALPNNADAEKGFKILGENISGCGISPNGTLSERH